MLSEAIPAADCRTASHTESVLPNDDAIRKSAESPESYRAAGVDIAAGNALVQAIAPLAEQTRRPGAEAALGGFGAVFDPRAAGFRDPLLVAATDGVGTKVKLAVAAGRHQGVGIDLVAMCANDLVVQGAEPLFFLDYYATGHLESAVARDVVGGIAEGCRRAGCALIGGETAEMPGLYTGGEYDLAGFCVGAAERGTLLSGAAVMPGDVVLGLASDGLHANGFSLVRKVLDRENLGPDDPAPWQPQTGVGEALLTPTRIYARPALAAHQAGTLKALAHITGGGLVENVPRVLPEGMAVDLDAAQWPLPPECRWLAERGGVPADDLVRTFNCGIGMVAVCGPGDSEAAADVLRAHGETVYTIGRVVGETDTDGARCRVQGAADAWAIR